MTVEANNGDYQLTLIEKFKKTKIKTGKIRKNNADPSFRLGG